MRLAGDIRAKPKKYIRDLLRPMRSPRVSATPKVRRFRRMIHGESAPPLDATGRHAAASSGGLIRFRDAQHTTDAQRLAG
jgi:hypothetical protein